MIERMTPAGPMTPARRLRTLTRISFLLAGVLASAGLTAAAQEAGTPPPGQGKSLEDLDQRLRILERKEELAKEAAAAKEKETVQVTLGKEGLSARSADGAFQVKLRGYVHFDGRFFADDQKQPSVDTFVLRRVRPVLEATVGSIFDVRIMPDFGDGKTQLQDAYIEARFAPGARLRAGKFKPPVGLERLQSATDMLFVERSLPTNLAPNRDLGIQLSGDIFKGYLNYAVGVFNGVVDGSSSDADINDTKEWAARLLLQPFRESQAFAMRGLFVGVAATRSSSKGTLKTTGLGPFKTAGQAEFFSYFNDGKVAGTVVADGDKKRFAPQAYFNAGRFGMHAEYTTSSQEVRRNHATADLKHKAWQTTASFMLTPDTSAWKGVSPKRPFNLKARQFGAVELVARYGRLTVDDKAFPVFADPAKMSREATEAGLGLNWYLTKNVKAVLDGSKTTFQGAVGQKDREDEKVLFTRLQISF